MLCVEDAIDTLNWTQDIGGLKTLIDRSEESLFYIEEWVKNTNWIEFLTDDKSIRSNTGITFKIIESWFLKMEEKNQREIMKETNRH